MTEHAELNTTDVVALNIKCVAIFFVRAVRAGIAPQVGPRRHTLPEERELFRSGLRRGAPFLLNGGTSREVDS